MSKVWDFEYKLDLNLKPNLNHFSLQIIANGYDLRFVRVWGFKILKGEHSPSPAEGVRDPWGCLLEF